jgi:hypothetical protein
LEAKFRFFLVAEIECIQRILKFKPILNFSKIRI